MECSFWNFACFESRFYALGTANTIFVFSSEENAIILANIIDKFWIKIRLYYLVGLLVRSRQEEWSATVSNFFKMLLYLVKDERKTSQRDAQESQTKYLLNCYGEEDCQ